MRTIITVFFSVLLISAVGQESESLIIKAGQTINKNMPQNQVFYYPSFLPARVVFKDKKTASGKMNYNLLVDEMQFVNENGDTLAVTNEALIKEVQFAADTFYYDNHFLRLVGKFGGYTVAERVQWSVVQSQRIGAY